MKTYSKIRLNPRWVYDINNGVFFKNTPNEISLIEYDYNNKKNLPKDYISKPFAVHYTAISDIMNCGVSCHYIVSERFKLLVEEYNVPNVDFYEVPLYVGRLNSNPDYNTFTLADGKYFLMHVRYIDISELDIDYENSKFVYYCWGDDFNIMEPRELIIEKGKNLLDFASTKENNIKVKFTENLFLNNPDDLSDILFFNWGHLSFHFISHSFAISNAILAEYKKRKFKGILESKPVIFSQV